MGGSEFLLQDFHTAQLLFVLHEDDGKDKVKKKD